MSCVFLGAPVPFLAQAPSTSVVGFLTSLETVISVLHALQIRDIASRQIVEFGFRELRIRDSRTIHFSQVANTAAVHGGTE